MFALIHCGPILPALTDGVNRQILPSFSRCSSTARGVLARTRHHWHWTACQRYWRHNIIPASVAVPGICAIHMGPPPDQRRAAARAAPVRHVAGKGAGNPCKPRSTLLTLKGIRKLLAMLMLRGAKRQDRSGHCPLWAQGGTFLWYRGSTRVVLDQCQDTAGARGVRNTIRTIANAYSAQV